MSTSHGFTPNSSKRTAHFAVRWLPPSKAIVTARGELDAANASEFFSYAASHSVRMTELVLDLTGVEFVGTAGFSALQSLHLRCAAEDIEWTLLPSPAVKRLLQICDPESALPVAPTVDAASDESAQLLQLVAKSG